MKKNVRKVFKNRKGNAVVNLLMQIFFTLFILYGLIFLICSWLQSEVSSDMVRIASNMADTIAVEGKLTTDMQPEFKRRIDNKKFFIGNYEIHYSTYSYKNGFMKKTLGTSQNGSSIGSIEIPKYNTIRVVINSKSDTILGKVKKIISPGKNVTIAVEGEAYVD